MDTGRLSRLPRHELAVTGARVTAIASTFELRVIRDAEGREMGHLFYPEIRLGGDLIGLRDPRESYDLLSFAYTHKREMVWGPYPVIELSLSDGRTWSFLDGVTKVQGIALSEPESLGCAARQFISSGRAAMVLAQFLSRPFIPAHLKTGTSLKDVFEELSRTKDGGAFLLKTSMWEAFEAFLRETAPASMWGDPLEQIFAGRYDVYLGEQRRRIEVAEAKALKVGDVLLSFIEAGVCEAPRARCVAAAPTFQWLVGGGVGDGTMAIPPARPKGAAEWKVYPQLEGLKKVTAEQWPVLLRALIGSAFDGFTVVDRLKEIREREVLQEQREARIRTLRERCFNGTEFEIDNVRAGIGMRLLFTGTVRGVPIHIVDGVQDVAIYMFRDRDDAVRWANGELPYRDARPLAEFFTPHSEGWEERVRSYLRTR